MVKVRVLLFVNVSLIAIIIAASTCDWRNPWKLLTSHWTTTSNQHVHTAQSVHQYTTKQILSLRQNSFFFYISVGSNSNDNMNHKCFPSALFCDSLRRHPAFFFLSVTDSSNRAQGLSDSPYMTVRLWATVWGLT